MLPRAVCHASGLLRSSTMTCPAAAVHCLMPGPSTCAPGLLLAQLSSLEDSPSHVSARRRTILQAAKTAKRRAAVEAPVETDAQDYEASSIQVLEGLEPVRKRPGMYIGNTGQGGLHHLVYEVLDNCIDEVQGGHATRVEMELDLISGWVTVTDNGRGIPTSTHAKTGKSALETVLTVLHAGGKFGGQASGYSVSGGLHGVGISVVNALSEATEVRVWRGGVQYMMSFSRGHAQGPLQQEQLPACDEDRVGTQVRFRYDPTIFSPDAVYDPETLRARLRELAFLNSSATLLLRVISPEKVSRKEGRKQRAASSPPAEEHGTNGNGNGHYGNGNGNGVAHGNGNGHVQAMNGIEASIVSHVCAWSQEETAAAGSLDGVDVGDGWHAYRFEGGLSEFVASMNTAREALHEVIYFSTMVEQVGVEVALQWCSDAFTDTLVGFANSIRTVDGGTHLDGTRAAITRTINTLAKKLRLVKDADPSLSGDCIREGLVGCVSVKVRDPEFEGQTKTRLGNPEVKRIVDGAVAAAVGEWLELRPAALAAIVGKALTAAKAADAAKKARELVRRKAVLTRTTLPGKLADCTSNKRDDTEIFVVEGDSAGGSAKQARDRHTQAILPLRGKILNVERCDEASMLKNNEIANLIVALGLGSKTEGCSGLRYGKVVILTDADVDGAHIRTLLLTFLFRYRRELFEEGHVYVAVPPLYKVEQPQTGRGATVKITWCFSDAHLQEVTQGLPSGSYTVQRFKGLGEMMPEQLWDTTLDPKRRTLRRLTIRDADEASRMFNVLMGSKVAPRRELIQNRGSLFTLKDLDI